MNTVRLVFIISSQLNLIPKFTNGLALFSNKLLLHRNSALHEITDRTPSEHMSPIADTLHNITFVSGNPLKKNEVNAILSGSIPCQLLFDTLEFEEPQATPIQISQAKCRQAAAHVKGPCLVEDTSLCFNALNGLPGPYIKWFIESLGNDGLARLLDGFEDKSAFAQCVVSLTFGPGQVVHTFIGIAEGSIVKPVGPRGFGWDSVFVPVGYNETFAQMEKEEKNRLSHRFKAMVQVRTFLSDRFSLQSAVDEAVATEDICQDLIANRRH